MKLYELQKGDEFRIAADGATSPHGLTPPAHDPGTSGVYRFDHADGMYSYCTDEAGNVRHFAVWTPVEPCSAPEVRP